MAAVPSIGRAVRVEGAPAPEADLTRALYEQYANQIFRYCLHQLGSREEAEDAVQSTFLNAFRGIKRGVVPELESAWLFKIAHNVCLSRRRTSWRRGRIESPTDFDVVEELTPAPSRRADELMGLQDVLEQMPDNQRRAILLREWQGLSYREIGEELELSQAAVETLIFRARRSLAAGLEQPPEAKKRKLVRGADLGNVLAGIKSLLLGGGAAAKVAATVAVVSAGTVVAAAPVQQHRAHPHHPPAPAAPAASSSHPAPGRFATLGAALSGTSSYPDDSTVAALPAGPAPVATPSTEATPRQVAGAPDEAPPAPATDDRSKTESNSIPPSKGGDLQGDGKNGDRRGREKNDGSTAPAATQPVVATAPVQSGMLSSSKGGDSKSSDKGDDSKKPGAAAATPPVTLAVGPDAPTQAGDDGGAEAPAAVPAANVPASATQSSESKTTDRPKDTGKGKDT